MTHVCPKPPLLRSAIGLAATVLLFAGCVATNPGAQQPSPVTGTPTATTLRSANPRTLTAVASTLPSGFRAGAFDVTTGLLWLLTRANGTNAVQLDAVSPTKGYESSLSLGSGANWLRGAASASAGTLWLAWGQSVVSVEESSRVATSHQAPWTEGDDGRTGRVVDLAVSPGGPVWVAVYGSPLLYSLDTASDRWSTLPLPNGQSVGFGTRLASVPGHVIANTMSSGSPAVTATQVLWLAARDSAVVESATGAWAAVTPGTVARFAADGSSLGSVAFANSDAGPQWNEPMALGPDTLWVVQKGSQRESLLAVALNSGADSAVDLPLIFADVPVHAYGATNGQVEHLAADPNVMAVVSDGGDSAWVITSRAGDVQNGYPAFWVLQ